MSHAFVCRAAKNGVAVVGCLVIQRETTKKSLLNECKC
jgi:hypothetical protein